MTIVNKYQEAIDCLSAERDSHPNIQAALGIAASILNDKGAVTAELSAGPVAKLRETIDNIITRLRGDYTPGEFDHVQILLRDITQHELVGEALARNLDQVLADNKLLRKERDAAQAAARLPYKLSSMSVSLGGPGAFPVVIAARRHQHDALHEDVVLVLTVTAEGTQLIDWFCMTCRDQQLNPKMNEQEGPL